jgi:hypothetical protein
MVTLFDTETGEPVAEVTEEQWQTLVDFLEEEDLEDQDYYLDEATLTWMEEEGADADLIAALRAALGGREGMEVTGVL